MQLGVTQAYSCLDLFGVSQNVATAWRDAGYSAVSYDIKLDPLHDITTEAGVKYLAQLGMSFLAGIVNDCKWFQIMCIHMFFFYVSYMDIHEYVFHHAHGYLCKCSFPVVMQYSWCKHIASIWMHLRLFDDAMIVAAPPCSLMSSASQSVHRRSRRNPAGNGANAKVRLSNRIWSNMVPCLCIVYHLYVFVVGLSWFIIYLYVCLFSFFVFFWNIAKCLCQWSCCRQMHLCDVLVDTRLWFYWFCVLFDQACICWSSSHQHHGRSRWVSWNHSHLPGHCFLITSIFFYLFMIFQFSPIFGVGVIWFSFLFWRLEHGLLSSAQAGHRGMDGIFFPRYAQMLSPAFEFEASWWCFFFLWAYISVFFPWIIFDQVYVGFRKLQAHPEVTQTHDEE